MSMISTLHVESRQRKGKGASRALRLQGSIPGVLYGGGEENIHLILNPREVLKRMQHRGFFTRIFELSIDGQSARVLCKSVQFHPVTDQPLHIDFMRVNQNTRLHIKIPIKFINEHESPGIKQGARLNVVVPVLEVACSADHIPDQFVVDLKGLEAGASIPLDSLNISENIKVLHVESNKTIATILMGSSRNEVEEKKV